MSFEARMLGEMARGVLDRRAGDPWQPMLDGGWIGVGVDEASGGAGGTLAEASALVEAGGEVGSDVPIAEALAAAMLLAATPDGGELIASLGRGEVRAVLAGALPSAINRRPDGSITAAASTWLIPWAERCTHVVVVLADGDGTLALGFVALEGVPLCPGRNVAGEPRSRVLSAQVAIRPLTLAGDPDALLAPAAALGAARLVGAMRTAQRLSVEHANGRRQFGRTIGSFQAVRHELVRQVEELSQARAALDIALDRPAAPGLAYAARIVAGRAARPVAEIAHQVHGAIGTTLEHRLRTVTLRALAWRLELGHSRDWSARLGGRVASAKGSWWTEFDEAAADRR
jgi:acyl-CoA dehydrogenase